MRQYFVRLGLVGGMIGGLLVGSCAPQPEATTESKSESRSGTNSGTNSGANSEPIAGQQVVATTALLCDITTAIAGETIDLTCLMSAGQDPHTYRLKPSDRAAIESADLILHNGYDLMPGLAELVKSEASGGTATPAIVAVAEQAVPEPILFQGHDHHHDMADSPAEGSTTEPGEAHEEHEEHEGHEEHEEHEEHETGDGELVPDPHVWHDARNGKAMVSVITEQLTTLNPDRATDYSTKATALQDRLDTLHVWMGQQIATIPEGDRQLVTTHDAFGYLAAAYGLVQSSALSGLSPNEKPSPATLAAIVEAIKTSGVPTIFAENTSSTTLIETVARDAGITVAAQPLLVDSPDPAIAEGADYPAMLAYNTCVIVNGLGGKCDRQSLGF
jgi:manganese/iron transport system substrate-binding protein